jgi:hypothetical protein
MTLLLAFVLAVWPPALWLWAASRPDAPAAVMPAVLAGAALPFLLAALAREGILRRAASGARWLCLFLMLADALFIPKMMWAFRLHHGGLTELALARAQVERFRASHGGRAPATLEELGPLPALRLWTVTEGGKDHLHPATSRVTLFRGDGPPPDDGGWGYDPEKGRVFLSCSGLQPKTGSRSLSEL